MGCRSRSASLPARRDGRSSRTAASHPTGCRRTQRPPFASVARRSPLFRSPSGCHSRMAVGTSSYRVRTIAGSSPAPPALAIRPCSKNSSDSSRTRHTRQLTGSSVTSRVPSVRPAAPTRRFYPYARVGRVPLGRVINHARAIGSRARTLVPHSPNCPVYPSYYPRRSSVIVRRRIHLSTSLRPG